MTMIYFAPKQNQNGVLCLFTSKFQTSTIGLIGYGMRIYKEWWAVATLHMYNMRMSRISWMNV